MGMTATGCSSRETAKWSGVRWSGGSGGDGGMSSRPYTYHARMLRTCTFLPFVPDYVGLVLGFQSLKLGHCVSGWSPSHPSAVTKLFLPTRNGRDGPKETLDPCTCTGAIGSSSHVVVQNLV